jgi:hypothetical protein
VAYRRTDSVQAATLVSVDLTEKRQVPGFSSRVRSYREMGDMQWATQSTVASRPLSCRPPFPLLFTRFLCPPNTMTLPVYL